MKTFLIACAIAAVSFSTPALAGAYATDANPTLPMVCRDLIVAYRSVAAANQSSPGIAQAQRLYHGAIAGCQTNPREAIRKLEVALHLVTPL